jgi:hypothetical protein
MQNFIQYIDENYRIKTKEVEITRRDRVTFISVSGIETQFFILSLFLDNKKTGGVYMETSPNLNMLSIINDFSTIDIALINKDSFYNPFEEIVLLTSYLEGYTHKYKRHRLLGSEFNNRYLNEHSIFLNDIGTLKFTCWFNTSPLRFQIDQRPYFNNVTKKFETTDTGVEKFVYVGECFRFMDFYCKFIIDESEEDVPVTEGGKHINGAFSLNVKTNEVSLSIQGFNGFFYKLFTQDDEKISLVCSTYSAGYFLFLISDVPF